MLRYLKQTNCYLLVIGGDPDQQLNGYSDTDFAGDPSNRRSTSGMVFWRFGDFMGELEAGSVTLSSTDAEYVA